MTTAPEALSVAFQNFARDPARSSRTMRQALAADLEGFVRALVQISPVNVADRGIRYALFLLNNSGELITSLMSPTLMTFPQACSLTKCMVELDVSFVNTMLDVVAGGKGKRDPASVGKVPDTPGNLRLLDLIGEFGSYLSNWRPVTRLYQEGSPRIQAKCAALLTRYRFDYQAVAARFGEGDPRVRAGIVEALWAKPTGQSGDDGRLSELLQQALVDPNNRVAGNACLALYNAGDSRSLRCLTEMLGRESAEFQVTAAWVMGQSRDIRFAGPLTRAARSSRPELRKTALRSLTSLDPIVLDSAGEVPVPEMISAPAETDHWELWIRAFNSQGEPVRGLRSIDFFLAANDLPVLDYDVEFRSESGPAEVRIALPARSGAGRALMELLHLKPRGQKWALSEYGPELRPSQLIAGPELLQDPARIAATYSAGLPGTLSAGASCRSLLRVQPEGGVQHLVVLLADSAEEFDFERIRAHCRGLRVRLHIWLLPGFEVEDEGIARRSSRLESADSMDVLGNWWSEFSASLQECYILTTASAPRPSQLAIRSLRDSGGRFSFPATLFGRTPGQLCQ